MFHCDPEVLSDKVHKFVVFSDNERIPYSTVLKLWQNDEDFRTFFISLLEKSPFSAFFWETPAITKDNIDRPFEFVLIDSPFFSAFTS